MRQSVRTITIQVPESNKDVAELAKHGELSMETLIALSENICSFIHDRDAECADEVLGVMASAINMMDDPETYYGRTVYGEHCDEIAAVAHSFIMLGDYSEAAYRHNCAIEELREWLDHEEDRRREIETERQIDRDQEAMR